MAVDLIGQTKMNHVVSHLPGVIAAVSAKAQQIGTKARAELALHRDTGAANISVSHGETDSFVNLNDPAALSIEFGHMHNRSKFRRVGGLYIVTGAAGLR